MITIDIETCDGSNADSLTVDDSLSAIQARFASGIVLPSDLAEVVKAIRELQGEIQSMKRAEMGDDL